MEELLATFGRNVRDLRKRNGLTQAELASRADLHRTYVADLERGARNASLHSIARVAGALGATVSELCRGIDQVDGADRGRGSVPARSADRRNTFAP